MGERMDDFLNIETLPKSAQDYFVRSGFLPDTEHDANNFILSKANVYEDRTIKVKIFDDDGKKVDVTIDNSTLYKAYYPRVWENLSVDDKVYVTYKSFKELKNKFCVDNKLQLHFISVNSPSNEEGHYNPRDSVLYLNFATLTNPLSYNGLKSYYFLAHEINHASQHNLADKIMAKGSTFAENDYQKSLIFHMSLKQLFEIVSLYFDEVHQDRLYENSNTDGWDTFMNFSTTQATMKCLVEMFKQNILKKWQNNLMLLSEKIGLKTMHCISTAI